MGPSSPAAVWGGERVAARVDGRQGQRVSDGRGLETRQAGLPCRRRVSGRLETDDGAQHKGWSTGGEGATQAAHHRHGCPAVVPKVGQGHRSATRG